MFRACICSLNSFSTRLDVHEFWNPIRFTFELAFPWFPPCIFDSWVLWIFAVCARLPSNFLWMGKFFFKFMLDKLISPDLYFYRVGVNSGW
ncbi:uncharacterized protein OCT59_025870 [Rhizophagus irregularis]|uniref:uncharacterized protein n=1 Tax=Rhizophagus irregularis TaxID=588596 RepID=UPI00332D9345|nr:hypothetical protein OCT59_025870 [Rhizophagus irregularis]